MQLYYKDHRHLMEKGNIKLSKSVIKTLHEVISIIIAIIIIMIITIIIDKTVTSTFLSQVKLSFSSTTFEIIFITFTLSHSNSEMSNLKCQNFLRNFHHPHPKSFPLRSIQLLIIFHLLNPLAHNFTKLYVFFHLKLRIHLM